MTSVSSGIRAVKTPVETQNHGHRSPGRVFNVRHIETDSHYSIRMKIKEVSERLEVDLNRANYYKKILRNADLIDPPRKGNYIDYTESDLDYFSKLHTYCVEDNLSATDALRYIKRGLSPKEALDKYDQVNKQLEAAQRKIVELKKPSMWERIRSHWVNFFKGGERGTRLLSRLIGK